ncbi:hypothetical protein ACIBSW_21075 [Actinoplanes sp. NPDC049668]|uniref:hypothetical protein n=1 Tax=unclassified Actinoplanes TaxID=2626549 RepID=UPI0033BC10F0
MSLEDDLRTVLRDRAAEPASRPDLLGLVNAGVARDRRRRAVIAGGSAALALAAVVAVPVALAGGSERPPRPPAASPSASPVAWDVPGWEQPAFPLAPSWLPDGAGRPEVILMGTNTVLQYEWPGSVLSAEVGPVPGTWESEGEEDHPGSVGGRRATVRTAGDSDAGTPGGQPYVGVRWRLADGQWAQVVSFGPRTEAQVLRFAAGLRPGRVAGEAAPYTFAEVPPGLTLQHQSPGNVCLAPRDEPVPGTDDPEFFKRSPHGLCLVTTEGPFDPAEADETLAIGGRRAAYFAGAGLLRIELPAGRVLELDWDAERIPLTRDDIVRFAEGVRVKGS